MTGEDFKNTNNITAVSNDYPEVEAAGLQQYSFV